MTTDLIKATLLTLLPTDGSTVGNTSLRRTLEAALASKGVTITEDDYWSAQTALIEEVYIATGKGRGGSVKLIKEPEGGFELKAPTANHDVEEKVKTPKAPNTARATSVSSNEPPQIISYRHPDKRVNNPEVGMVNTATGS